MRSTLKFLVRLYLLLSVLAGVPASASQGVLCLAPRGHLAIEAGEGDSERRAQVKTLLDDLLAEHLAMPLAEVAAARDERSLIKTIEKFIRPRGRGLRPLEITVLSEAEKKLAEDSILDPERPEHLYRRVKGLFGAGG